MSDQLSPNENSQDELSTGLKVLSFCIPLAGAVLYFMNKEESPKKAKTACTLSLWGAGVIILINILATVFGVVGAAASGGY